jgi:hypothetical protein
LKNLVASSVFSSIDIDRDSHGLRQLGLPLLHRHLDLCQLLYGWFLDLFSHFIV